MHLFSGLIATPLNIAHLNFFLTNMDDRLVP